MKMYDKVQSDDNKILEKLDNTAYFLYNFNKIPPIIGIIVANRFGNTLMVLEYGNNNEEKYGPIKTYLSEKEKNFLDIDLISMYFSSFTSFAGETNIQNLSNLEIHGSNIKIQIFFLLNNFMVILFLNSKVYLNLKKKSQVVQYFEKQLKTYEHEFKHFNASNSRKYIKKLEEKGKIWLKKLNRTYMQTFQNIFLEKHEILDMIMNQISPIIKNVLEDYFERIPKDIKYDMSKELGNQIQDKISEFNLDMSKK